MGFAYSAGRWVGKHKVPVAVLAVFAALALIAGRLQNESKTASSQALADSTAKADAAARALRERCTDNISQVIGEAQFELNAGNANGAYKVLQACSGIATDPHWAELNEKALLRSKAEDEKAAKVALAEQARRAASETARKKSEGIRLGMSQQEVLDSKWGRPQRVNRTINAFGTREQWVYGDGNYLYFSNGVLESIQN